MIRDIEELGDLPEKKSRMIYREAERKLFKQNKLYLFLHIIRGFFPGVAILAFLEAYYRLTIFRDHSLVIGIVLGVISIAVWIWVENFKTAQIKSVIPDVMKEYENSGETT